MWKSWQVDEGEGGMEMPLFGSVPDERSTLSKHELVSFVWLVVAAQRFAESSGRRVCSETSRIGRPCIATKNADSYFLG